jgi:hypothetical protein
MKAFFKKRFRSLRARRAKSEHATPHVAAGLIDLGVDIIQVNRDYLSQNRVQGGGFAAIRHFN